MQYRGNLNFQRAYIQMETFTYMSMIFFSVNLYIVLELVQDLGS